MHHDCWKLAQRYQALRYTRDLITNLINSIRLIDGDSLEMYFVKLHWSALFVLNLVDR